VPVVLQNIFDSPQLEAASQSASLVHPQTPSPTGPSHTGPSSQVLVQSAHEAPEFPHTVLLFPGRQVVPSQHPPLHCPEPVQPDVQRLALQALPVEQSDAVTQPQTPETHLFPFAVAHEMHVAPVAPQTSLAVPAAQVPALQHPPLQTDTALHVVLHTSPLHAWPTGQSVAVLQPQAPSTHAGVSPLHGVQVAPGTPHAGAVVPGWHSVPSQQASLQTRPPAHEGEQVWVEGLHACCAGQSVDEEQEEPTPVSARSAREASPPSEGEGFESGPASDGVARKSSPGTQDARARSAAQWREHARRRVVMQGRE
jgi:hypothetical protein